MEEKKERRGKEEGCLASLSLTSPITLLLCNFLSPQPIYEVLVQNDRAIPINL